MTLDMCGTVLRRARGVFQERGGRLDSKVWKAVLGTKAGRGTLGPRDRL